MKVAIIGSRNITEFDSNAISCHLPKNTTVIISGGASGVDSIAERLATELSCQFIKILPDYNKFGKNAPLVRNQEIVKLADYVIAIWDFTSRGTAHTIAICIRDGIPVRVIGGDGAESPQLF